MKFTIIFCLIALFSAYASANTVSYDQTYDNAGQSLATVTCSDGSNGLLYKGFSRFSSLPAYPRMGGTAAVGGWNSENCGTCWSLEYNGKVINVLAVDHAGSGFNINLDAMNELTNGQATFLGRVNANVQQVPLSHCGMSWHEYA